MMMQTELPPSWPFYNIIMDSTLAENEPYALKINTHLGDEDQEFSTSFITGGDDSCGILSEPIFPELSEELDRDVEYGPISSRKLDAMCRWLDEIEEEGNIPLPQRSTEEDMWSPSTKSSEGSAPLDLPGEETEIDLQSSIHHLLTAYGEAVEMGQNELARVIVRCVNEKASTVGEPLERVAFSLFRSNESEGEYLRLESIKNFRTAFKAFYQIFPYGRFAHFAANSAILEAVPEGTRSIHVVDLDMESGVQWPPLIEFLGRRVEVLRLTSIKSEEEDESYASNWRFEETKNRLLGHARLFGVKLIVEERNLEDLVGEVKRIRKRGGGGEWLAFNCMVGLPHMGQQRRRRSHVLEFLRVAKGLLGGSGTGKGIIMLGDGEGGERTRDWFGYGSFFEGCLMHYRAMYESMEMDFPSSLAEARLAMENLFLSPYVSSLSWAQKWDEVKDGCDLQAGAGLQSWRVSRDNLMEAKELVKEAENSYRVVIEGQKENEMVLEWKGTPLVRVSAWI